MADLVRRADVTKGAVLFTWIPGMRGRVKVEVMRPAEAPGRWWVCRLSTRREYVRDASDLHATLTPEEA